MDTFFLYVAEKSTSLILRRKLGSPLTGEGGGRRGSHFNGRYSLTDHKKTLLLINVIVNVCICCCYWLFFFVTPL